MSVIWQKTLKSVIGCTGVGLHSGQKVSLTLYPGEPGSGIVFRRSDLGGATVAATHENVNATMLCTSIANGNGACVAMIEHLMSAFAGLGIDNAIVELDGSEVPVMDGSAAPFVFLIECVGVVEQRLPRRAIQILKTVEISDGERSASLSPSDGFSVSVEIDFDHPAVGRQEFYFELAEGVFKRELCRARTFGFLSDATRLRERGYALGASLDNAVVIDDAGVLNEGGLRYEDELVRHKALDGIGDLYLAGAPILGHMHGVSSGHTMNHKLLTTLFADDDAWCDIVLDDTSFARPAPWRAVKVAATA